MSKIPVYFIPGMASNPLIFEHIKLDPTIFETHYLSWPTVSKNMTLQQYVLLFKKKIHHNNPVLIGVSFGGIIVQELHNTIQASKTIIISSVRSPEQYPSLYNFARKTKIYKILPLNLLTKAFQYWLTKNTSAHKLDLYKRYLTVLDVNYLDWSIDKILNWQPKKELDHVLHIHGDRDELFPVENIKNAIILKGGTHAMIITKFKWFNKHLPSLITNNTNEKEY